MAAHGRALSIEVEEPYGAMLRGCEAVLEDLRDEVELDDNLHVSIRLIF